MRRLLPYVFAVLKTAATLALIGALVGEFVTARQGLRRLLTQFSFALKQDLVFATVLMVGLLGVLMRRFDFPTAPVIVGMILGPLAEAQLRNAMSIGEGNWLVFVQRPISLGLLIAALALCILVALPAIRSKREEAFQEN